MNLETTLVTEKEIDDLAHLLCEYQQFYNAIPNYNHNTIFLKSFLSRDDGLFFMGKDGKKNIGYVSLYFSYSSVSAQRIAILNDLYVRDNFRGQGAGGKLIDFAINYAKEIGIAQIRWCTRADNNQAQDLYAKYDAVQTDWLHYDLGVGKSRA